MLRRIARWLSIAGALLLVLAAALVLLVRSIDPEVYKPELQQILSETLGRQVRIEGRLHFVPSLVPVVGARGLTLANARWGSQPEMARADSVEIAVDLLPLLRRSMQIERVELRGVRVLLESDGQGRVNWSTSAATRTAGEPDDAEPIALDLRRVIVEDASVVYRDGASGETTELDVDELGVKRLGSERSALQLSARLRGQAIRIEGETSSLGAALTEGAPLSFGLDVDTDGLAARVDGELHEPFRPRSPDLRASLELRSLADLASLAGRELPASKPLRVAAKLSQDEDGVFLARDLSLQLGGSRIDGQLDLRAGKRARIGGHLSSALIDLADLSISSAAASVPRRGGERRIFSDAPLPLDVLRGLDLDVSLHADRLRGFGLELAPLDAKLVAQAGRLEVAPLSGGIAGGRFDADLALDASRETPDVSLRAEGAGIVLGDLLRPLSRVEFVVGAPTQLSAKLSARGDSVRAWMASLEGELFAKVGPGRLRGRSLERLGENLLTQLVEVLDPGAKGREDTRLECAVAWLQAERGLVRADDGLALETSETNFVARGGIDLRAERLGFGFSARSEDLVDLGGGALTRMVYVAGPLSDPQLSLDPKGVAEQAALAGALVFTMGLSWVAENLMADRQPCRTLERRARQGGKQAGERLGPGRAARKTKEFLQRLLR